MTVIDMTNEYNRTSVVLITLESSLAFYAKHQFWPGGVSALKVCWRDGYSHHRTAASALEDIVACRRMLDPNYEPSDTIVSAWGSEKDEASWKKAQARKRKALRTGDKWHVHGRPGAIV